MTSPITLLFVDDDTMNCKVFKRYFAKFDDIRVITALSAQEAITLIEDEHCFDIVISDQRMPETKGHQLLAYFQKNTPQTFRALTSANGEEIESLLADSKITGIIQQYIEKPWDFSSIKDVIYSSKIELA